MPARHEGHRELPFPFAGSGASAAGGMAMLLLPAPYNDPRGRMVLVGAGVGLAATELMKRRLGMVAEPYEEGPSGTLMRTAARLTAAAAPLSVLGSRSRAVSR